MKHSSLANIKVHTKELGGFGIIVYHMESRIPKENPSVGERGKRKRDMDVRMMQ